MLNDEDHTVAHRIKRAAGKRFWALSGLLTHGAWMHDEYKRIYLYHVRKTAGTAISFAFMRLSGDPHIIERRLSQFTFAQNHGYRYVVSASLIRQGRYFFGYSHHPAYVVDPPASGTFKFTVLRNPVERVVSEYRYLANETADYGLKRGARAEERYWGREGFEKFLDTVPRHFITNQLYMFSKSGSVDEAVARLSGLDLVLQTEQLDRDLGRLEDALQLRLSLSRERVSVVDFEPTEAQRSRLEDLLQPEFEILRQINNAKL
jgi:hypothetical protein